MGKSNIIHKGHDLTVFLNAWTITLDQKQTEHLRNSEQLQAAIHKCLLLSEELKGSIKNKIVNQLMKLQIA